MAIEPDWSQNPILIYDSDVSEFDEFEEDEFEDGSGETFAMKRHRKRTRFQIEAGSDTELAAELSEIGSGESGTELSEGSRSGSESAADIDLQ